VSGERRAAAVAALLLAAVGLALAEGAWLAAALCLAAWALAGLAAAPPSIELSARRLISPSFLEPGRERLVEVEVEIRNAGLRLELVELEDRPPKGSSAAGGSTSWKGSLDSGASAFLRYSLRVGRGLHEFSAIRARAVDPFAAVESLAELPCPGRIVAPPAPAGGARASFSAPSARAFSGFSRARRAGAGLDFAGTRQYGPGDPLRDLNWRAWALWGEEIVNLREEERALDAGLILDCRAQAYERDEIFEAAVGAAASLAESLLDGGHRVAFLAYGSTIAWTPPGAGRVHRLRIRAAAAGAALGSHAAFERFDNLPVALFPPRSLVLLVSPLLPEDVEPLRSLVALGYSAGALRPRPGAACPPPGAAGRPPAEAAAARLARRMAGLEAELTASRLLRSGVALWDWEPGRPLGSALRIGALGDVYRGPRARGRVG